VTVVPPQFTARSAASAGSGACARKTLALYRALPSLPTAGSASRSEPYSPSASPLPRTVRQLSGAIRVATCVLHRV